MRHDPRPILITRNVSKSCFNFYDACMAHSAVPEGNVVIRLSRRGECTPRIEYPAAVDGENICFEWGDLMYSLPVGRYNGDIYDGNDRIAQVQFEVMPNKWRAEPCEKTFLPKGAAACSE